MVLLPSETFRKCSFLTAPLSALRNAASFMGRKRSRLLPFVALVLLAAAGAGFYGYALHRWDAAQKAVKEKHYDEAQRDLKLCLLVWPRSVPVHLLAARTARLRGELKEAEAILNRCLKLNKGSSAEIQLEFLLLRVQGGEIDRVVDELMLYVETGSPDSPLILETLALVYMQTRRYGQAFKCLSRWHDIEPDSPEPFRWRGWVLERMNDRDAALNEYKQALARDPNHFQVRFRLAETYLERNDPGAAAPLLEELWKQFPDRGDVQARLGQCRFIQGEMEEARRFLEAALKQLPDDPAVLIYLAKIDLREDPPRLAEAEDLLHRAIALDPTDLETQYQLIRCLEMQGRPKEAQALQKQMDRDQATLKRVHQTLREDADRPVTDPVLLTEVGLTFLRAHNDHVALFWLNRALESDPDYQPALKALVEYYEKNGQATKAAPYLRRLKLEKTAASPEDGTRAKDR